MLGALLPLPPNPHGLLCRPWRRRRCSLNPRRCLRRHGHRPRTREPTHRLRWPCLRPRKKSQPTTSIDLGGMVSRTNPKNCTCQILDGTKPLMKVGRGVLGMMAVFVHHHYCNDPAPATSTRLQNLQQHFRPTGTVIRMEPPGAGDEHLPTSVEAVGSSAGVCHLVNLPICQTMLSSRGEALSIQVQIASTAHELCQMLSRIIKKLPIRPEDRRPAKDQRAPILLRVFRQDWATLPWGNLCPLWSIISRFRLMTQTRLADNKRSQSLWKTP